MGTAVSSPSPYRDEDRQMPSPDALAGIASTVMLAHTTATAAATEIRMHREECAQTRQRTDQAFGTVNQRIDRLGDKVFEKIDDNHNSLNESLEIKMAAVSSKQEETSKTLFKMVGACQILGLLIPVAMHFFLK